jgi:hypothetical protein
MEADSGEKCSIVSPQNTAWPLLDASSDPKISACCCTTLYGELVILKATRNVSLSPYLARRVRASFKKKHNRNGFAHKSVVGRIAPVHFRCNKKSIPRTRAIDDHLPTFKFILTCIVRQTLQMRYECRCHRKVITGQQQSNRQRNPLSQKRKQNRKKKRPMYMHAPELRRNPMGI